MKPWIVLPCLFFLAGGCSGGKQTTPDVPESPAASSQPAGPPRVAVATENGVLRRPDLGFQITFPGEVTHQEMAAGVGPAQAMTHRFECTYGGENANDYIVILSVTVSVHPPGALAREDATALYARITSDTARAIPGEVLSAQSVEVQGHPGQEFTVMAWDDNNPKFLVERTVIVGDSLYLICATTVERGHRVTIRREFIDSFKIISE